MTQIAISDEIASTLASAATSRGCSQEQLASMLIEEGLRREDAFDLTPEQENRLLQGIAQAERGECVDGEAVMARFDKAIEEIRSR